MSTAHTALASNMAGVVETPTMAAHPYLIDADGRPFVPTASAGVTLGMHLGDPVTRYVADHPAPGVTVSHHDPDSRHALAAFACIGNRAELRGGAAAGRRGWVIGKRGEAGTIIALFDDDTLAQVLPGDAVAIRAFGQGSVVETEQVSCLNVDPALLHLLVRVDRDRLEVRVRACISAAVIGNGFGRPAEMWDLDLQIDPMTASAVEVSNLRIGDLVCLTDLDVRHNAGYAAGRVTVGIVAHGDSRVPGHGPGVVPILTGPGAQFQVTVDGAQHTGLTTSLLAQLDD